MTKTTITVTLILIVSYSFAQNLRKKKTKYALPFSQTYYVLKGSKSIKDGDYELKHNSVPIISGQYKESKRTGIWTYFNSLGKIQYKYNYDTDSITEWGEGKFDAIQWSRNVNIKNKYYTVGRYVVPIINKLSKRYKVIIGNETLESKLDTPPLCMKGNIYFQYLLFDNLRTKLPTLEITSFSLISFIVDSEGNAHSFKIHSSTGHNFENEFITDLEKRDLKWIPGKLNNMNVSVEIQIPIIIKQQANGEFMDYDFIFNNIEFLNIYKSLEWFKAPKFNDGWEYSLPK